MKEIKDIGKKIAAVVLALCFVMSGAQKSEAQSGQVGGKNWKVNLSGKFIYDDNVTNSPRNSANKPSGLPGRDADEAFEFSGEGRYKFNISDDRSIAADYSLDHTGYTDLSQYDFQSHTFAGDGSYKIPNTESSIWRLGLRYFFMYNLLDNDAYNGLQNVNPNIMFLIDPRIGFTRINYNFRSENNYQTDLRDTDSHSFGIDHYYFFSNFTRRIRVGYSYTDKDATGAINDRDLHSFRIDIKTPLIVGINLKAQYRYRDLNYDTRAVAIGAGIQNDDVHNYMLEFSKVLIENLGFLEKLTGFVKYQHTAHNSTDKLHEFDKNIGSLSLKGNF